MLINNAGVIQVGPIDHMHLADFEEAMAVHFWGPLYTMLAAIRVMRPRGGGRIVNVASIGGKIGVPHLVPYSASKFALTGLSDGLRAVLEKQGHRVLQARDGQQGPAAAVQKIRTGQQQKCEPGLARRHRPVHGENGDEEKEECLRAKIHGILPLQ